MKVEECDDPGGTTAGLPSVPTNNCDSQTLGTTTAVNADGSFSFSNTNTPANPYTVYWLPDNTTFGEPSDNVPTCGTAPNYCVLYLGPAQTNFADPHLFSAPFSITNNGDDGGENPGDGSPLAQTATSASDSTVAATPTMPVADGKNLAKVTVTLEDTDDTLVTTAKQVTLNASGGATVFYNGTAGDVGMTDAGAVSFTVTDTNVQTVTFTATDDTDSDLVLTQQPQVQFVAPVVTAANSNISASPTTVPTGSTTITVTLDDQAIPPNPVEGKIVTLSQGAGHTDITPSTSTTNAAGQATFMASDATSETVTFTATDTTDSIDNISGNPPAVVVFGNLSVSPTDSKITASPTIVSVEPSSGGVLPTATVTVALLASDGVSPVSGRMVTLSASSSNAVITPSSSSGGAMTDSNGKATFTVADATVENVTFTADDTTDGIDNISGSTPAVVDFESPAPSASTSTMTASASTQTADGVTPVTITVTMYDQFGDPVSGVSVSVTGSPAGTNEVAPQPQGTLPAGTTNNNGVATFYAYDTTAETITYTAEDTTDNVTLTETVSVTFDATAPQADNSTVSAVPPSVAADGTTASTVTVKLEDHNANPVSGKAISLAASGGSSQITAVQATTDSTGQAIFKVTDGTSETVMYTATDSTDGLVLAGQAVAVTFGTPPPVAPAVADSTIVAAPNQVPADGSSSATVTIVLSDADGNALSGKTVALDPQGGSSSVTTVQGTTDSDGEATFTVTDKAAEAVTYDATDVTDTLPITGQSVTVTFAATNGSSGSSGSGTAGTGTSTATTATTSGASTAASTTATTSGASTSASGDTGIGSGSSSSSATPTSASSGGTLALTGVPDLLPWMISVGGALLGLGTIGRRRLIRARPALAHGGDDQP